MVTYISTRLCALSAAAAIATGFCPALGYASTRTQPQPASTEASALPPGVSIAVEVDESITDSQELHAWVEKRAHATVHESVVDGVYRGEIRIDIRGSLYWNDVTMTAFRGDEQVGDAEQWTCECTSRELLNVIGQKIGPLFHRLEVTEPTEPVDPDHRDRGAIRAMQSGGSIEDPKLNDEPPAKAGKVVGATLVSLGIAGIGAGVPLIAIKELPQGAGDPVPFTDLFSPGIAIASAGGALLLAGVITLVVSKKRRDRADKRTLTLAPSFGGRGQLSLSLSGRF